MIKTNIDGRKKEKSESECEIENKIENFMENITKNMLEKYTNIYLENHSSSLTYDNLKLAKINDDAKKFTKQVLDFINTNLLNITMIKKLGGKINVCSNEFIEANLNKIQKDNKDLLIKNIKNCVELINKLDIDKFLDKYSEIDNDRINALINKKIDDLKNNTTLTSTKNHKKYVLKKITFNL